MVSLTETHKKILWFLEENGESSSEQIATLLKDSVSKANVLLGELEYPNDLYVKVRYEKSKQFWSITIKGIEYLQKLELHSFQERQTRLIGKQNLFILISVLVASISLIIAGIVGGYEIYFKFDEDKLIEKQLDSVIPVIPSLKFTVEPNIKYGTYEFANYYWINETFYRDHPKLYIILYNVGQMETGHIHLLSNDTEFESDTLNIRNIEGLSANESYFKLWFNNCSYTPDRKDEFLRECNRDTIPLGRHTIVSDINF